MVVQQRLPIPVWGWATAHQRVQVRLADRMAETQADGKGMWMVRLPKLLAADHLGAALTLIVSAEEELAISGVAVGEVWLCAGDTATTSSSRAPQTRARRTAAERTAAERITPVRAFVVAAAASARPLEDVQPLACWTPCTPAVSAAIPALGVHFARAVQEATGVPVGMIIANAPGSLAESWTSRAALASEPVLRAILERADQGGATWTHDAPGYRKAVKAWEGKSRHADPGNKGQRRGWHLAGHDDKDWHAIDLPRRWDAAGVDSAGAVWFRRTLALPTAWKGRAALLSLGPIEDQVTAYLNGTELEPVSALPDEQTGSFRIPGRLMRGAQTRIALRVFAGQGPGGVVGPADHLSIALAGPSAAKPSGARTRATQRAVRTFPLTGEWRYRLEVALEPKRDLPPPPLHTTHQDLPAGLSNGMLQPLVPYGLRGAIWDQGRRNAPRADQYRTLLHSLIRDWRTAWGLGDFPVGIVQLPGVAGESGARAANGDSPVAELREAQGAALQLAHVGVIPCADLASEGGTRPPDQRVVGERLASWALSVAYGLRPDHAGPRYQASATDGALVRVSFLPAGVVLASSDGAALRGFTIAGPDRRFVVAQARIVGAQVEVTSPTVASPQAVRYGWSALPCGTLCDDSGKPAAPFRTDSWPLSTQGRR
jgi:sialate O-acetylesterase